MPRKVSYGPDYDDGYEDDYDDYDDYDYDHEVQDDNDGDLDHQSARDAPTEHSHQIDHKTKPGTWQCCICTYENDETSSSCDVCGTVHKSALKNSNSKVTVASNDPGAHLTRPHLPLVSTTVEQSNSKYANSSSDKGLKPSTPSKVTSKIKVKDNIVASSLDNKIQVSSSELLRINRLSGSASISRDNNNLPQDITTNVENLQLNKNTVHNKNAISLAPYKPEKWMLLDQEQGALNQLNLAIVGHVDSGKSTLSGRLLHLLGRISKKAMHKYEKEAKEKGKGSFAYAWAMDESSEERERGVTMTVAIAYFDSKKYRVVLLDSPGHKDFVPKMISGATQADAAILVVDASIGSFEAGMDGNGVGQTKEHAQLIRSFGVEHLIVAVNKMDAVGYSKERFDLIQAQLGSFLRSCGFKDSSVSWIPISVIENQNLVTTSSESRLSCWYQGLCLLDAIDSLPTPPRDVSKPLILPICDIVKSSMGQVMACGKLEIGAIRNGSKVLVMPPGKLATVRTIERDSQSCSIARAGDNVAVILQGIELGHVIAGSVLCHPDYPLPMATKLELKILVLEITMPILTGLQVEFQIHHVKESAKIAKLVSLLDQKTGKISKSSPRILKSKQSAIIEVALDGPVCVDEFSNCRALGRAFLRSSGDTIAVGVVTRVIQ